MRRLLPVVQLPSGGSTISATKVQQVAADGLPNQWHRQRRVAHGHSRLPHRAAQRIGQAQGVAGAGRRERGRKYRTCAGRPRATYGRLRP